jgi:hypothetical protein
LAYGFARIDRKIKYLIFFRVGFRYISVAITVEEFDKHNFAPVHFDPSAPPMARRSAH